MSGDIEREHAVGAGRPLQDFGMPQRTDRIRAAGAPMIFHAPRRKFEILRIPLVVLRAVNELDDAVEVAISLGQKKRIFWRFPELLWQFGDQIGECAPELLFLLELVRACSRPA